MNVNGRLTITEVAERVGVTTRTIRRWETARKVKRAKRDWRGWRVYDHDAIEELIEFHKCSILVQDNRELGTRTAQLQNYRMRNE